MTIIDVFKKAAEIKSFPNVEINTPLKWTDSTKGTITTIKKYGIAVRFIGMKWDVWFWNSTQNDKRSKYMYQLKFI